MDLLHLKGGLIVVLFGTALLIPLIPLKFSDSRFFKNALKISKTFAAGVFLGMAFLHLYPDSVKLLSSIQYPLTGLMAISSYMCMLFIEKVAFVDNNLISHGGKHPDLGCHCVTIHSDEEEDKIKHLLSTLIKLNSHLIEGDGEKCNIVCSKLLQEPLLASSPHKADSITSISIAFVLSIHSMIEGLTIGIRSDYNSFLNLAIAIFIHKIPESLIMGITLIGVNPKLTMIMISIYSIGTPLGMIIGMIVNSTLNPITEGIFISTCIGTFLYIAVSEIITEEFAVSKLKHQKFISLISGILLVSGLILLEEFIT